MFSVFPDFELCLSSSRPKSILDGSLGVPGTYSIEYIYNDITYIYNIHYIHILSFYQSTHLFHIFSSKRSSPRSLEGRKDDLPLRPVEQKGPNAFRGRAAFRGADGTIGWDNYG